MKVIDGIPVRLRGVKRNAATVIEFIHKCCECGLRHDVRICHKDKSADMDITFDRIDKKDG